MANTIPNLNGGTALTDVADDDLLAISDTSDSATAKPVTVLNVVSDILAGGNTAAAVLATGTTVGNLTLANGSITDSSGAISFGNENLSTTGTLSSGVATLATGSTIGNLTLANGSITDSSGAISFGDENLTTTGTLAVGATTSTGAIEATGGDIICDRASGTDATLKLESGGHSLTIQARDNGSGSTGFANVFNTGGANNTIKFGFGSMSAGSPTNTALTLDQTTLATFAGDVLPAVTEAQDLGSATFEWDNIFLQNAATVSDANRKNDLGALDDKWANFASKLVPKLFTLKAREIKPTEPARTEERQKTETITEAVEKVELVDGVPTLQTVEQDREIPVTESVQVVGEDGKPVFHPPEVVTNDEGEEVELPPKPVMFDVPVMETVEIPAKESVWSSHSRPHTGFIAQEVKALMDECGIDDWAGYAYDEELDKHFLRYIEFIPLILHYAQARK